MPSIPIVETVDVKITERIGIFETHFEQAMRDLNAKLDALAKAVAVARIEERTDARK